MDGDPAARSADSAPGQRRRAIPLVGLLAAVAIGVALRWRHVLNYEFLLGGDDGVVALMGLHMLKGRECPLVFYGQHYMGTLDAMVAALFFLVLGVSAQTYKLTVLLYATGTLLLMGWAVARLWGWNRACLAVGLMALSPAAIRWQMDQPNYGVLFLFGAGILVLTVRLIEARERQLEPWPTLLLSGWAFLAGLAFWANSLVLSFVLPLPVLLWLRGEVPPSRTSVLATFCFVLGMLPLVLHNIEFPFATLRQFVGFFLDVSSRSEVEGLSATEVLLRGLWHKVDPVTVGRNLIVAVGGFGLEEYEILALLSYPAGLALLTLVGAPIVAWVREARNLGWRRWLATNEGFLLSWLWLATGLILLLGSTRTRYMALLVLVLPLLITGKWQGAPWSHPLRVTVLAGLVLYLVVASVVLTFVKPITAVNPVPGLARFLESQGLTRGYAGYELAYPLAVQTNEAVLVSPIAGPLVDDRYAPYLRAVESAPAPFYIYPEGNRLAQRLADYLRGQGIGFRTTVVEGHRVFWDLARQVRPGEFLPEPYLGAYQRTHGGGR